MNGTKKWYYSRTIWWAIILVVAGIAEFLIGVPETAAGATIVSGIVTAIIRVLTNQGLTK